VQAVIVLKNQITHPGKHFGHYLIISDILVQHSVKNVLTVNTLHSSVNSLEAVATRIGVTEHLTFSTQQELRRLSARVLEALQL
jgi:hypothetical protein